MLRVQGVHTKKGLRRAKKDFFGKQTKWDDFRDDQNKLQKWEALYKFQWERAEREDYQSVTAVLATKKIAIADDIIRGGTGMVLKGDQAHQI